MRTHGVPDADPDRQRQGLHRPLRPGTGEVLFDRICRENGIRHLLTAPRSPTTTGKVERFHKTLRREFLDGKVFARHRRRPGRHRRLGATTTTTTAPTRASAWWLPGTVPPRRHGPSTARRRGHASHDADAPEPVTRPRTVGAQRQLSASPPAATRPACGSPVRPSRWSATAGSCSSHTGVCSSPPTPAATAPDKEAAACAAGTAPAVAPPAPRHGGVGDPQGRLVSGNVCFAGTTYRVGNNTGAARSRSPSSATPSRSPSATSSSAPTPSRHDRTREHGALANPGGRPRRINAA